MIRVCVIGAGIVAKRHILAIDGHPESVLAGVADIIVERAQEAAAPYGASAYTDYIEMLDAEKPDACIINLPHGLHEAAAVACARRGIHTLLEKPMSVSYASCQRINEAFRQSGALLQVGHPQRYNVGNRKARELIESGEFGQVVMISNIRAANYFVDKRPRWFLKKEMSGGGIWMNFGAHCLDKLCFLTGSTVQSVTGSCTYHAPGVEVDGSAQVLARTENGVTAAITICGYSVTPVEEVIIYLTEGNIRICGDKVWISRDGKDEPADVSGYTPTFIAQWGEFMEGVLAGKILHCDGEYAAHIVRHIESLYG